MMFTGKPFDLALRRPANDEERRRGAGRL